MSAVLDQPLYNFRPMTVNDLGNILVIEKQSYDFPWSFIIFEDCLRIGYSCWVLEEIEDIIGYAVMTVAAGECHLLNLCIKDEFQNQGFGQSMLSYLLDVAGSHGAEVAFLEVRPSNRHAINLYSKAGFNEVGLRKDYYPAKNGREDAKIFARQII